MTPATATPAPNGIDPRTPVWHGAPAVSMRLESRPLATSPDGERRVLVRARLYDAGGNETRLERGGDFDFLASGAAVQWQTRLRFEGPAAIVRTSREQHIVVRVRANIPAGIPPASIAIDTHRSVRDIAAAALGPHLAQVGWFPRERSAQLEIVRMEGQRARIVGVVAAPSSTYRDTSVAPGHTYRYAVRERGTAIAPAITVQVPAQLAPTSLDALRGKGMWLFFSPSRFDDNWIGRWDVARMLDLAASAGIRHVELRVAYGELSEITADAKATVDAFIDGAIARKIAVVAWTVPRSASFEDLATSVAAARYRTARGGRFAALAIDLERGEQFMGSGTQARAALGDYARLLRAALGPAPAIIATVEDPALGGLSDADVPYATIAANVSALQPMAYWRAMARGRSTVSALVRTTLATTRRLAGRSIPLSLGGQTSDLGGRGVPSAGEIAASLRTSRAAGALGETFFDWDGTVPAQWDALAAFRW